MKKIKKDARSTEMAKRGFFMEDRELLHCAKCGLEENVTYENILVVTTRENRKKDVGLRFKAIKGKSNKFRCPKCKSIVTLENESETLLETRPPQVFTPIRPLIIHRPNEKPPTKMPWPKYSRP